MGPFQDAITIFQARDEILSASAVGLKQKKPSAGVPFF
jgi:hypothetical protein